MMHQEGEKVMILTDIYCILPLHMVIQYSSCLGDNVGKKYITIRILD